MNWFDANIVLFLNQFSNHRLDWLVSRVYTTTLVGGSVTLALAWAALFDRQGKDKLRKHHELLLGVILLCGPGVLVARALALSLPFRTRPIYTPELHFHTPQGAPTGLLGWSSFPSDHATLFFALATGIFFVSRRLGLLAASWVALVMSFPALYLGIHWPTDIIAGACLGVSVAQLAKTPAMRKWVGQLTAKWYGQQPGIFFAVLYLWSYEIANLFEDGRRVLKVLWHMI